MSVFWRENISDGVHPLLPVEKGTLNLIFFFSSSVYTVNVLYLSADPDDIMSPSGDQEHLIKFWNLNQKRIYEAFIIWTFLNQTIHSWKLTAIVYMYLFNITPGAIHADSSLGLWQVQSRQIGQGAEVWQRTAPSPPGRNWA